MNFGQNKPLKKKTVVPKKRRTRSTYKGQDVSATEHTTMVFKVECGDKALSSLSEPLPISEGRYRHFFSTEHLAKQGVGQRSPFSYPIRVPPFPDYRDYSHPHKCS